MLQSPLINHGPERERVRDFATSQAGLCFVCAPKDYGKSTLGSWLYRDFQRIRHRAVHLPFGTNLEPRGILHRILKACGIDPFDCLELEKVRLPFAGATAIVDSPTVYGSNVSINAAALPSDPRALTLFHSDLFSAFLRELAGKGVAPKLTIIIDNLEDGDLETRNWVHAELLRVILHHPGINIVFFCRSPVKEAIDEDVGALATAVHLKQITDPEQVFEFCRQQGVAIDATVSRVVHNALRDHLHRPADFATVVKALL